MEKPLSVPKHMQEPLKDNEMIVIWRRSGYEYYAQSDIERKYSPSRPFTFRDEIFTTTRSWNTANTIMENNQKLVDEQNAILNSRSGNVWKVYYYLDVVNFVPSTEE